MLASSGRSVHVKVEPIVPYSTSTHYSSIFFAQQPLTYFGPEARRLVAQDGRHPDHAASLSIKLPQDTGSGG